ncbi:putative pentatricopeptide repeat-containing protein [Tripterygium wilfordii]|uniref:Putative pentatricopeptide repeat-containing protein n=1 Tax=Tripterygium wilfordii TaxID=458696 RepID=A0A7J7DH43_TRIWF|nr:putative pentatricopeptide repeat-containing protein At3g18840 [Tripterygium wilfordii]XP_038705441.1 putative pentatricopeptide repeat-containing protein At3g18840 [Tripterygium wilfordii]XP_038705442.1 putative pentatricopeptide repeat-containing protein At3g18840 [Tripterygium wilfordii]XP_038705443.1 putative pentatricopeptide repeat-containing protein At3g18840 [Tripterygium wilfordii]KAF5745695.1 putative pentatricopeptide repeat-containing protein [Tripterygium wilfordii]
MRSLQDGFLFHLHTIKTGWTATTMASNQLVHLYAKHGFIQEAHKLFDEIPDRNVFSWNTIISACIKSNNLTEAQALFNTASQKDLVTYNSMLSGYAGTEGYETHAFSLFVEMQKLPSRVGIDEFTLTTMVNLTAKLSLASYGKQLHSYKVKTGNDRSRFALSSLVDMYSKCGCFEEAYKVFQGCGDVLDLVVKNAMVAACCRKGEMEMALSLFWREPEMNDTISWNTLISGHVQNGYEETAMKLFIRMGEDQVRYNEHTLASVLSACAGLRSLKLGKEAHTWVLKRGFTSNPFISSGIVDVYCKCENMKYAERVHSANGIENTFSISSMIVGYSLQGSMLEARRLFDSLVEKNVVVWTALFSGYLKSQKCEAVFELLREFSVEEGIVPDALILVSVLGACALQAFLDPGKQIHGYVLRLGLKMDEKLISAMVDMYSKCGNLRYAEKIFWTVMGRDLVLYNVMIAGYGHHGHVNKAVKLFQDMLEKGLKPDAVTFIALLSACRHGGLVELGEKYFNCMLKDYHILPEIDHYACMIDLYGRANQLEKAVEFTKAIPVKQDAVILGALLNACKLNRNTKLARETEKKLLSIEGDNGARYVQLANVYAAEGNWTEMGRIRNMMKGNSVKKLSGCSWVYVDCGVHAFTSGDITHSKAEAIYSLLDFLTAELLELSKFV